ncbi:MAG: outer membrane protein assembly factor BamE [Acidobacteriota bacterium]|nr:outer membrane protein assembly factor BamE [Acidobacteriota bacterium]
MARLILLIIVLAAGYWLFKNSAGGLFGSRSTESPSSAPIDRAREAARKSDARHAESDRLGTEDAAPREAGRVHENMTPSEVRALMGSPDEVTSSTTETGAPRETWHYRSVGKKVVFENGVAVSVE